MRRPFAQWSSNQPTVARAGRSPTDLPTKFNRTVVTDDQGREDKHGLAVGATNQLHRVLPAHFKNLIGPGRIDNGAQPAAAAASLHDSESLP